MYTIGERIKFLRTIKNLNQKEFSNAIKIGQSRLSEFESNKTKPSFDTLYSIKEMFNISLDWLISGEGEPFTNTDFNTSSLQLNSTNINKSENKISKDSEINTIGQRIKYLRISRGLSLQELAELLGKSKGNISGYENDKFEPSAKTIISLAKYFEISTDWILNGVSFQNQNLGSDMEIRNNSFSNSSNITESDYPEKIQESKNSITSNLSEIENDIIGMFRQLDERDKEDVFDSIKLKYDRSVKKGKSTSLYSTYTEENKNDTKSDTNCNDSGIA